MPKLNSKTLVIKQKIISVACLFPRQGQDFGDEYFAELDMIEVVEMRKEGYESDVDEGKYPKTKLMVKKKIT